MVRTYKRKTDRGASYSEEQLKGVLEQIKIGQKTIRGAARECNIPFSTIQKHLKGTRGLKSKSQGKPYALPIQDESALASGIKTLAKWGWGLTRKEILQLVQEYVNKNNIKTPFKNGRPGKDWFIGFRKRHHLSIKKPQSLEFARKKASADPFIIEEYFDSLNKTLNELNLMDKPAQIYNLDETSFCMDPSKTKVVSEKIRHPLESQVALDLSIPQFYLVEMPAVKNCHRSLFIKGKISGTHGWPLKTLRTQILHMQHHQMVGCRPTYLITILKKTV